MDDFFINIIFYLMFYLYLYIFKHILPVYECSAHGGQKNTSDTMELEFIDSFV